MALVYRAIWTDPNPALIAAGRSAFAAWLKSKEIPVELPETGTAITANAEISVTAVDDGDVSALRARLIEERPAAAGVERWTTTVVWLTSKEEGWIWVDLERVSDDPFARQPDVAAPRLVSELLRSGSERGSTQRLGPDGGPARFAPTRAGILTGRVVAIDPGHNGENFTDTGYIDTTVFNGRQPEACDTTGTETDAGYTEAQFNFNVALDLTAILRSEGASVVLTRTSNTGVGPCITERAAIGNVAHADAAVSIHADGGPPYGRGYTILEPVADGINTAVIAASDRLGTDLRNSFGPATGTAVSNYDGTGGIVPRDNLGGVNLTTVPKVFIECANMRNVADAALVSSATWQATAAHALAVGLTTFLTRR